MSYEQLQLIPESEITVTVELSLYHVDRKNPVKIICREEPEAFLKELFPYGMPPSGWLRNEVLKWFSGRGPRAFSILVKYPDGM